MTIHRPRPAFFPLLLLIAAFAAAIPSAARAQAADSAIVAEASAFMDAYAHDLRTGDREAVAARYDRRGAYIMFNGRRDFAEWNALAEQYRTQWQAPVAFEWADLIYEPAGPDGVVVNGSFLWTPQAGAEPLRLSYTGLLVRQEGQLRIRLEDEAIDPPSMPPPPPTP
jgi:hypothetical protein